MARAPTSRREKFAKVPHVYIYTCTRIGCVIDEGRKAGKTSPSNVEDYTRFGLVLCAASGSAIASSRNCTSAREKYEPHILLLLAKLNNGCSRFAPLYCSAGPRGRNRFKCSVGPVRSVTSAQFATPRNLFRIGVSAKEMSLDVWILFSFRKCTIQSCT